MRKLLTVVVVVVASACPVTPPPVESTFHPVTFPADFAWGTAIAQWQTEGDRAAGGGVIDSNWKRWMDMGGSIANQTNDDGNGFTTLFREDIARAKALGLDTFRVGLDWSRIEPQPDVFDDAELAHFVDILDAIRAEGMHPVVTLWHWTVPVWVQQPDPEAAGGVVDRIATKDRAVVDDFEDFVRHVLPAIKGKVDTYTVLNEPFSMIVLGYVDGRFPPGKQLQIAAGTDFGINLLFMHAAAFDAIKELDDEDEDGDGVDSFVGLTMSANDLYAEIPGDIEQERSAQSINYVFNDWAMEALTSGKLDVNLDQDFDDANTVPAEGTFDELKNSLEFIGVQYYGPGRVTDEGTLGGILSGVAPLFGNPQLNVADYTFDDGFLKPHNGMGREIFASGFADTLDRYAKWGLPLIITENGTTTNAVPDEEDVLAPPVLLDVQAGMYMLEHVYEVGRAIERGVDVRGYYHWTLTDNFEWADGRTQHFGAYSIDFSDPSYPRTLNKQGEALQDMVAAKGITEELWNKWVLSSYPTDARESPGLTTRDDPFAK
ncbi:MAG: family 1 glycosylhydrolase [Deltaproteobacteria bacterium]|nr:family 1 glycosylhydrolase [Deltaproteobacteria bacterium]